MISDPKKPTRASLAAFLKDARTLRAFEQLFDMIPSELNALIQSIEETGYAASVAENNAVAALQLVLDAINNANVQGNEALEILKDLVTAVSLKADFSPQVIERGNEYQPPATTESSQVFADRDESVLPDDYDLTPEPVRVIDSDLTVNGKLTLPKMSGYGLMVDKTDPTYGWRDMQNFIVVKGVGASDPDWSVFRGSIYAYEFANAHLHEAWINFHMPHDWAPGTDLFIHVHWSQNVVDTGGPAATPGTAKWYFNSTYADGHGTAGGAADPFIAPVTTSVTQQASTTQYGHMIAEVQLSQSGGGAGFLDTDTLTVDGVILCRIYRDPADVADTLDQNPFVHFVGIHYQSTSTGTKQKSPDFYV